MLGKCQFLGTVEFNEAENYSRDDQLRRFSFSSIEQQPWSIFSSIQIWFLQYFCNPNDIPIFFHVFGHSVIGIFRLMVTSIYPIYISHIYPIRIPYVSHISTMFDGHLSPLSSNLLRLNRSPGPGGWPHVSQVLAGILREFFDVFSIGFWMGLEHYIHGN